MLAGVLLAAAIMLLGSSDLEDLRDYGQRVKGEVVAAHSKVSRSRNSKKTHYFLVVHYRHPGGAYVIDEIEVDHEGYTRFCNATAQYPRAATVLCAYNDPKKFTLQEVVNGQISDKESSAMVFLGAGGFMGMLLLASGWWNLRKAAQAQIILPGGYSAGSRWGPPLAHLPPGYGGPAAQPPVPYEPPTRRANPNAAPWER